MELSDYAVVARRWWWLVIAGTILGGALGYGVSRQISPTYSATATLLVVEREIEGSVRLVDLEASVRLANTFSQLVTLDPVLVQAVEAGGFDLTSRQLKRMLSVTNPEDTQLLRVTVSAGDPELARQIADTVAETFVISNEAQLTSRPGVASVVERARLPIGPSSPNTTLNVALAAILGLLASSAAIIVLEYLDDSVRTPGQIARLTGLTTLGRLERLRRVRGPADLLHTAAAPESRAAEGYRALRTRLLQGMGRDSGLALLVTSPGRRDGKTATVANLGVVFASAGLRTLVVDADLRSPRLHRVFEVESGGGLAGLIAPDNGEHPVLDAVVATEHPQLFVLPAGRLTATPAEWLASTRMERAMLLLRDEFDVILVDSPAIAVFTDAAILAALTDASIVVVRAGETRQAQLVSAVDDLTGAGRPILGVALVGAILGQGGPGPERRADHPAAPPESSARPTRLPHRVPARPGSAGRGG